MTKDAETNKCNRNEKVQNILNQLNTKKPENMDHVTARDESKKEDKNGRKK